MSFGLHSARATRQVPVRPLLGAALITAIALLVAIAAPARAQAPEPGLAGGFEIDGNLFANNPGGIIAFGDDWLDGPAGPGTGVLNGAGVPVDATHTFHILDLTKNDDANVFDGNNKVFHDPNTYKWKAGSVPQKDDMENGLVHFSTDGNGDHWMSVAGDRRAINGNSYIDFEFLQNTLTKNGDGTFTSLGADMGRTEGDLLLTILLTKGGGQAEFYAQMWLPDGGGGFEYQPIPFPAGEAFVAANVDSSVSTTFDAFGSMTYDINQFGEASVNLDALLASFNECFGFATVFIRTKSSSSADATLMDFLDPIQVNMCLDVQPPTLTCPPDVVVNCGESVLPGDTGEATGEDDCNGVNITYVDSLVSGNCDAEYTIYRKWIADDGCGNTAECVQVIDVVDDTPPPITNGPQDVTVDCEGDIPPPDITAFSIGFSECGGANVQHISDVPEGTCPKVITRTYHITDDCGNMVPYVQRIVVDDKTKPVAAAPEDLTIECGTAVPDPNVSLVTASDNCGTPTVTHVSDVSDQNSCPQVITRTYRVTDDCGNSTDVVQLITIEDSTAPQASGPQDLTVDCADEVPAVDTGLINASDACGSVNVTFDGESAEGDCPKVITRTYSATDDCGNSTQVVHRITIDDREGPQISDGPKDVIVECVEEIPAVDLGAITATDNCNDLRVDHVGDQSDGGSCPETITRTYRVTDGCGNYTDYVQTITIHDTTKPTITITPEIVEIECIEDMPAMTVRGNALSSSINASDNCGPVTVKHMGDVSDGKPCGETIVRTYRAIDACGNWAEASQTIIIKDETKPAISSGPTDVTVDCIDNVPAADIGLIDATDNCGEVKVTHEGDQSEGACPTVITRTYRAWDDCGNTADFVQTITVDDDEPPTLENCAKETRVDCPEFGLPWDPPGATDNCDPNPTVLVVNEEFELLPEPWTYKVTRTYQAFDACGNGSETCDQEIVVHCEAEGFCTFTQGFWGNYGGKFNGDGTYDIIKNLLKDSPMTVGVPGRSVSIDYPSAHCVIERLPGGTTPTTLPEGLGDVSLHKDTCQPQNPNKQLPVDSQGKFENVLLSQTIALTLNMRYNTWLWLFPLSETFCTRKALPGPDKKYGTEDDIVDPNAPTETWHIPPAVLDAIDELGLWPTAGGLLDLANLALGGEYTAGASLSEINDAATAINEGFNECRLIVECKGDGKDGDDGDITIITPADPELPTRFDLGQNYPNPFNPQTTIQLAIPEATQWTVSIYNVAGQLIRRFDGQTGGPEFVNVEWNGLDQHGSPVATGIYLYRVKAGGFSAVKKMVLLK